MLPSERQSSARIAIFLFRLLFGCRSHGLELPSLQFARWRQRQRVANVDAIGNFVAGKMHAAVCKNLIHLNACTGSWHHIGDDDFAAHGIRNPSHSRKGDGRMLLQNLLHFGWRDVDPRAFDYFGMASGILDRAVLAERTEIAGPEISVRRKGSGVEVRARAEIALGEIAHYLYLPHVTWLGGAVN